ncbi:MAG: right-handed parallel beta-helix repeat-containing protein [Thermoguttaceae bacterium]|jgi:hypothetical protein
MHGLFCILRATLTAAVLLAAGCPTAGAAEWFAASDGKAEHPGTKDSPWDLPSSLEGRQKVAPGDTLWLSGGTYRAADRRLGSPGYVVRLAGREGQPVEIRGMPGQRVTLDGGLTVQSPATWLSVRDLEIVVSENFSLSRTLAEPGSHPESYNRPWGSLNVNSGAGCRYLNLVIHDNAQGISLWSGATQCEVHGCILYDNGWKAPDRGHGHAIYTQNKDGLKTIENCIMTGGYGYTLHAYGSSRAYVDNYLVRSNVCYNGGAFLVGGGRPSHNIRVIDNFLYNVGMQLGYTAPSNDDCQVLGNWIVNGDLQIVRYKKVASEGNRIIRRGDPRPVGPAQVFVRPYRLDASRANVVIFNWARQARVAVDPGPLLSPAAAFRLIDPRDFYGPPVQAGKYNGKSIEVPAPGEFTVYVLLKDSP